MNVKGLAGLASVGAVVAGMIRLRIRLLKAAGFERKSFGAWEPVGRLRPVDWAHRWRRHNIGFHMPRVNPKLLAHAARILPSADEVADGGGTVVFVPLCGKSVDMQWLAAKDGVRVVGVEVVPQAIREFFQESGLEPEVSSLDSVRLHSALGGRLTIAEADIFDPTLHSAAFRERVVPEGWSVAVWDRAALVAINPQDRARYLGSMAAIAGAGSKWLVAHFTYDTHEMTGPPFAVPEREVSAALVAGVGVAGTVPQVFRAREVSNLEEESLPEATLQRWGVSWANQVVLFVQM